MIHSCKVQEVAVCKIGELDSTTVYRTILNANKYQSAFYFNFLSIELPLDETYKLANGGYEINDAIKSLIKLNKYKKIPRPLLLLTNNPIGDREKAEIPYHFFFMLTADFDNKIDIISMQPLDFLSDSITYEAYLMMMLSTYIYSCFLNLNFHEKTKGCLLDYCDNFVDAEKAFKICCLCFECNQEIQKGLSKGEYSIEKVASAKRLMHKAANQNICFVIMPFDKSFVLIYELIKDTLKSIGWKVIRADETSFPRLITRKILLEILSSDLVIADLTTNNPNVFFELGMSYLVSNDILLITQENSIPFDIKNEQTIFYNRESLSLLKQKLELVCRLQ